MSKIINYFLNLGEARDPSWFGCVQKLKLCEVELFSYDNDENLRSE